MKSSGQRVRERQPDAEMINRIEDAVDAAASAVPRSFPLSAAAARAPDV